MSKPYYVTLTGSKNNAGDFLIKDRAFALLKEIRPDRDIIDYCSWLPITDEQLEVINNGRLLILLGGPSVRPNMYPEIFPLRENLDDIKVPIILFGAGWKSQRRDWCATRDYSFSKQSIALLKKIAESRIPSSVRDYHTLNCLYSSGFDNFIMTGCPAYYDLDYVCSRVTATSAKINNVAFSLGVSFVKSPAMKKLLKDQILKVYSAFPESRLTVAFHHSLSPHSVSKGVGITKEHYNAHAQFSSWLLSQGISYIDISGSAEALKKFYNSQDLHVGYRVHAHIYMQSISKWSCLFSEDGRGAGVGGVLGGLVFDPIKKEKRSLYDKVLKRFFNNRDVFEPDNALMDEVLSLLEHEMLYSAYRLKSVRTNIDALFERMSSYLGELP